MSKAQRPILVYLLLGIFFLVMFVLAYYSEGTIESGDSYQHYIMARYAPQHPFLLLDLWAKPVFTLVTVPFAQLGFLGINVFNILCATLTGWFAYLIVRKLEIRLPLLSVFFSLFAPVYLVTLISGLTEPLFGLTMVMSIYLVITDRAMAAALIISLLPFVRNEGFLLLPLFALAFLYRRKWLAIPALGAGTLIYSIIGYFQFKDFLWIMHNNPYKGADSLYGHGDLFHFVKNYKEILGVPMSFLFLAGVIAITVMIVRNRKALRQTFLVEELLIIAAPAIVYFVAHSLVLWKGLGMGSIGTWRVMAAIAPPAGLVALRGLDALFARMNHHPVVTIPLAAIISIWIIKIPFGVHEFPRKPWVEEVPLAQSAEWLKEKGLHKGKAYYAYPYLSYALDHDPYDGEKTGNLTWVGPDTPPGSIIIWDSHFGTEAGLPLERFNNDTTMEQLKTFISADPAFVKPDGSPGYFEVHLFRKK